MLRRWFRGPLAQRIPCAALTIATLTPSAMPSFQHPLPALQRRFQSDARQGLPGEPTKHSRRLPELSSEQLNATKLNNPKFCSAFSVFVRCDAIDFMNTMLEVAGLKRLTPAEEEAAMRLCDPFEHFRSDYGLGRLRVMGMRPVAGRFFEREYAKAQTLKAIANIVKHCGSHQNVQMEEVPLITVIASAGSGKTAYCEVIRRGLENGDHWGSDIERTIKEHCPEATRPESVIFVMASFHRETWLNHEEFDHVVKALMHRCYVDYVGFKTFNSSKTPDLPNEISDLGRFLSKIRSMEAEKHGASDPDRIAVVMLVDEVTRAGSEKANDLLVQLARMQVSDLMGGRVFIPVVTSLEVDLLTQFERPVVAVQLPPLTEHAVAEVRRNSLPSIFHDIQTLRKLQLSSTSRLRLLKQRVTYGRWKVCSPLT